MTPEPPPPPPGRWTAALIATLVLLAFTVALRLVMDVPSGTVVWDEYYMKPVVDAIIHDGWSVRTAIDYTDTKGPAFFWPHAWLGGLLGGSIESLRLVTQVVFVLGGVPLGLIAARCGCSGVRTAAVAALYALLPYNLVLGQIFMSEPSFVLGSLLLVVVLLWGFGDGAKDARPVAGPVVFGALLAILLHHRPHAVAYAAAAALVAAERRGWQSWPWWLACVVAGLLRLPLFLRWGGVVSPGHQDIYGLGVRLDSLTYLLVATLPYTAALLVALVMGRTGRRPWPVIAAGAAVGLVLGLTAVPDIARRPADESARYLGMVATALRPLGPGPWVSVAFAVLATAGGAAMAATLTLALRGRPDGAERIVNRLAAWTLVVGWGLYGLTRGFVFDRYLLVFAVLIPFQWVDRTPPWLRWTLGAVLALMAARLLQSHGLLGAH